MKLYIKQHVFSWKDKFSVKDEFENDRYFVEGELLSWAKKLHVYDTHNNEVIYIQQKLMTWLPRYHIFIHGQQVAEIVKKFTFLRPLYQVEGLGWDVEGDFMAHNYSVLENGSPVVTIYKEWFTWGDSYVLDIAQEQDELSALAVVLAIDCITAQNESSINITIG